MSFSRHHVKWRIAMGTLKESQQEEKNVQSEDTVNIPMPGAVPGDLWYLRIGLLGTVLDVGAPSTCREPPFRSQ